MSDKHFTVVFAGDIRAIDGNPHKVESPFGVPVTIADSNLAETVDEQEGIIEAQAAEIERLRAALTEIRDAGPMTVDDQRWRIALAALEGK